MGWAWGRLRKKSSALNAAAPRDVRPGAPRGVDARPARCSNVPSPGRSGRRSAAKGQSLASPSYPPSDHCDGHRFFNPGVDTDRGFKDLWRWRREGHRAAWPARRANRAYPAPPAPAPHRIAVTFIGQATFLITTPAGTLLTDPIFAERASPLRFAGPKRVRPPGLAIADLPPVDLILLSHNHYDHMDIASLRRLTRGATPPPIVTGLGNAAFLADKGIPGAVDCDWWQRSEPRPGLSVTFVPAQHWSSRSLFDRRRTLWGGFVVEAGGRKLYFCGDSGYCPWFAAIRDRCGTPDVALLPIGAYEPRWFMGAQHMNPADAVQAHQDLGARHSIGMHFGTFQLTDEGIDAPIEALAAAKAAVGLADDAFVTLDVGETRVF